MPPGWALGQQTDPLREKCHRTIEGSSEMSSICHILHGRTPGTQIKRSANERRPIKPERKVQDEDPWPLICHRPGGIAIDTGKAFKGSAAWPLHQ